MSQSDANKQLLPPIVLADNKFICSDQNEIDIRESVANTYLLILNLIKNEEILSQRINNLDKTLNEMRQLNKAGFLELTDVDQLELTILSVKNAQNTLQRQIDGATDLLKFQQEMTYKVELKL